MPYFSQWNNNKIHWSVIYMFMNYQGLLFVGSLNKISRWHRLKMLLISVENVFHKKFFHAYSTCESIWEKKIVEGFLFKMRLTIALKRIVNKFKPLIQTASFSPIWKFLWKKKNKKTNLIWCSLRLEFLFYFEGKWFWRFENFFCVTYESTWIFRLKSK